MRRKDKTLTWFCCCLLHKPRHVSHSLKVHTPLLHTKHLNHRLTVITHKHFLSLFHLPLGFVHCTAPLQHSSFSGVCTGIWACPHSSMVHPPVSSKDWAVSPTAAEGWGLPTYLSLTRHNCKSQSWFSEPLVCINLSLCYLAVYQTLQRHRSGCVHPPPAFKK